MKRVSQRHRACDRRVLQREVVLVVLLMPAAVVGRRNGISAASTRAAGSGEPSRIIERAGVMTALLPLIRNRSARRRPPLRVLLADLLASSVISV